MSPASASAWPASASSPRVSQGDIYDNALAESTIGLDKTELIHNERFGPWRTVDDVELTTLPWIDWWNTRRLAPAAAECEAAHYRHVDDVEAAITH